PPELQSALLGRRFVFMRGRLDDASANSVIAQLLLIGQTAAGQPVELYIDSPGGLLGAALSVYDVMQTIGAPVATTCTGIVGRASVVVLAGGASGQRPRMPHARIHLMEEPVDVFAGDAKEVRTQADEAARQRERWLATLARHTAHSTQHLARDLGA